MGSSGPGHPAVSLCLTNYDRDAQRVVSLAEIEVRDAFGDERNGYGTLALKTAEDGVPRVAVTITPDRRVGIGTDDPSGALDVRGLSVVEELASETLSVSGTATLHNLVVTGNATLASAPQEYGDFSAINVRNVASVSSLEVSSRARAQTLEIADAASVRSLSVAEGVNADSLSVSTDSQLAASSADSLVVNGALRSASLAVDGGASAGSVTSPSVISSSIVSDSTVTASLTVSESASIGSIDVSGSANESLLVVDGGVSCGAVSADALAVAGVSAMNATSVTSLDVAGAVAARSIAVAQDTVTGELVVSGGATVERLYARDRLATSVLHVDSALVVRSGKGSAVCGWFYWRRGDRAPTILTAIVNCDRGIPVVRVFDPERNVTLGVADGVTSSELQKLPVGLSMTSTVPGSSDVYLVEVQLECTGKGNATLASFVLSVE